MSVLDTNYKGPSPLLFNGHMETLVPSIFRKGFEVPYEEERFELPDGDFLDLDWLLADRNERLVVLTHGLEGNSRKHYITGLAKLFFQRRWDVLAWNCRSCSGEINRNFRLYHHGEIEDIGRVVELALERKPYREVVLIGISMGGNITLKYLGVNGDSVPEPVKMGIAISTPIDLRSSIEQIDKPGNFIYRRRFFRKLKAKILAKAEQYPGRLDISKIDEIKEWWDFDELYSGPINGFSGAEEFYDAASAINFVEGTRRQTILINAVNDPLLGEECFPEKMARLHPHFSLEVTQRGGHVGFTQPGDHHTWVERRVLAYAEG